MGMIEGNSGGRKVAVELNIIPFIDLMSILIVFLLLTAVWIQSSMLNIDSSVYGKKTSDFVTPPKDKNAETPFILSIVSQGYRVKFAGKTQFLKKKYQKYDTEGLLDLLSGFKAKYPNKEDVVLSIADQLAYSEMITGIDVLLTSGFPKISVATQGGL